ncbi:FeoB-associated Cys-rich membrane protein [Oligoflexus tunisiensis]|nr:FeoB-associated Cys-rich membrane protein [Oligoflexus tunisiensis]
MQPWDYLVFIPVFWAGYYLWQRRRKKSSCGACSACPGTKGCSSQNVKGG